VRVSSALPGGGFETDLAAYLQGITLTDPLGLWPRSARDVAGSPEYDGTSVNGAMWLDHDDDGFIGVTNFVVPPGGTTGVLPSPPRSYGASSSVCPRSGGPHTPYAYVPAPAENPSAPPVRVKRYYTASRVIAALSGSVVSCDQIVGKLIGPEQKPIQLEMRVGGCVRELDSDETACPPSALRFLDDSAKPQAVDSAAFELRRWPSDLPVSCAGARTLSYD